MSLWDKTDRIERRYLKLIIRRFNSFRNKLLVFDELNVLQSVTATYKEVDTLCKRAFLEMLKANAEGDELLDLWLMDWLDKIDEVTKCQWASETERKKQRLFEALMADILSNKPKSVILHDVDVARRYMERQFKQTGDDVTADFILKTYEDAEVENVMWITAKDERVCEICKPRDGRIYRLKDCPQWPAHYNCRCEVVPYG